MERIAQMVGNFIARAQEIYKNNKNIDSPIGPLIDMTDDVIDIYEAAVPIEYLQELEEGRKPINQLKIIQLTLSTTIDGFSIVDKEQFGTVLDYIYCYIVGVSGL